MIIFQVNFVYNHVTRFLLSSCPSYSEGDADQELKFMHVKTLDSRT